MSDTTHNSKELIAEGEMPAPRLELRWSKEGDSWAGRICTYSLVIPLREHDIRREERDENDNWVKVRNTWSIEIGKTTVNGSDRSPLSECGIDTPYRDGAHACWDSLVLGRLPIYSVCEGKAMLVENNAEIGDDHNTQ